MGWVLAVDFGTSYTTAAIAEGRRIEQVEVGDSRYLPSAVCLDEDGQLRTGRDAVLLSAVLPERTERVPKRALLSGETVLLGERSVRVVELVAEVLRTVAAEAVQLQGGVAPEALVLTHPVQYEAEFRKALQEAAWRADLPAPKFVAEPVAAALWYARDEAAASAGDLVAVFDFGGGTLDTAVLRRGADGGYAPAGPVGGDSNLGGEDIDEAVMDLIARHAEGADPDGWRSLGLGGTAPAARRNRAAVRQSAVDAKHALSDNLSHRVYLPSLTKSLQLTRPEVDAEIGGLVSRAVAAFRRTVDAADGTPSAVYLTGGSSRIPLVHDTIARELDVTPRLHGDPKSAVVLGAAHWALRPPAPPKPAPRKPAAARPAPQKPAQNKPQTPAAPKPAPSGVLVPRQRPGGRLIALGPLAAPGTDTVRTWPSIPTYNHPRQIQQPASGTYQAPKSVGGMIGRGILELGRAAGERAAQAEENARVEAQNAEAFAGYLSAVEDFCLGPQPRPGGGTGAAALVAQLPAWSELTRTMTETRGGPGSYSAASATIHKFLTGHYRCFPLVPAIPSVAGKFRWLVRSRLKDRWAAYDAYVGQIMAFCEPVVEDRALLLARLPVLTPLVDKAQAVRQTTASLDSAERTAKTTAKELASRFDQALTRLDGVMADIDIRLRALVANGTL